MIDHVSRLTIFKDIDDRALSLESFDDRRKDRTLRLESFNNRSEVENIEL